jgi:hypothetical protein
MTDYSRYVEQIDNARSLDEVQAVLPAVQSYLTEVQRRESSSRPNSRACAHRLSWLR